MRNSEYKFLLFYVFFFKQKTAYEMRISDWSSDVCSSDLKDFTPIGMVVDYTNVLLIGPQIPAKSVSELINYAKAHPEAVSFGSAGEIGRASCRERVCQYV